MIRTVVVGYGLAGRAFHCPLIARQADLKLAGIVARDPQVRASAEADWNVRGYADIAEALSDDSVQLVVIATPHDTHADLAVRTLEAGKDCVVDKVMALGTEAADRMIAARDASGKMLSVFHNRRWDWDYLTLRDVLARGAIGRAMVVESSVCRYAPPRTWRGQAASAGSILHDWGAHLVDQALMLGFGPCRRLKAWLTPALWPGVDTGGHGQIVMEFDEVVFRIETSRIARATHPRWWVLGSRGGFQKDGIDPQEDALRTGDIDRASEPSEHQAVVNAEDEQGNSRESRIDTVRGHWDGYYANIAEHLLERVPLIVTAEQGREVVRVLEAADHSAANRVVVEGPWG
ncbi:Gfo/Idh/MocA family oxidoreductase [Singulisphaera sp. PoT]|uniref:Gfo/Idh/MocA family oxidoreductase n=1 Tax=Singulisphaera sp. PoT TaxID=3411797 RepID=UPI003BF50F77